ncbi:unnamed protein product [Rotaria magnacalcarata]|uniref:Uncharacterized protein n=1 Tax=Rotaria magnacalcarata TaxID=392030 RepID=A0A815H4G4_9BILA|nr:unnamed protein product [Rotaria magnacalcarata]CAF1678905.1 unnamed protein product [Rotaria magnacalcarata]CAF1970736.1 unnamed protein product [Rotaria magnacalcarata]CAF2058988.1 unnamed protein product [Rotaria magnacalcarata]CAF2181542.1 unnamed protein product [Rotaria magnacalcarata]
MDLTGAHYLQTINCSSPILNIPEGPYLFSHHWPFTSITIQYQKQLTRGECYRDGSLHFLLSNNKVCSGLYYGGKAKLLCQFNNNEYCLINMKTIDGDRLTCIGSKIKPMTFVTVLCFLLILHIHEN